MENRKKWYECESCKGLGQSLRRESNPDSDGFESKEADDDDVDTRANMKEVQLNGGRKLEEGTEDLTTTAVTARASTGRRRRPGTSSDNRQKKLFSESMNTDTKDLTSARAQEEDDEEEEEEVEQKENVKAEEETEENEEEKDKDEEEDEDEIEEEEEEEGEEGAEPSNSVEHNKTSASG